MKTVRKRLFILSLLIGSILIFSGFKKKDSRTVGQLIYQMGDVSMIDHDNVAHKLSINDPVYLNYLVETKSLARCEIKLNDGSILNVNQNTLLKIDKSYNKDKVKRTSIELVLGSLWLKVKKLVTPTDEFSVKTPIAVAAVRGTDFKMEFTKDSTVKVIVDEGVVDCGEAPMLRDFDSFADWLKSNEEAFMQWSNKNNGEDFYNGFLKEFQEFQQNEQEEFEQFMNGEKAPKKKEEWVSSLKAGEKIVISRNKHSKSQVSDSDDDFIKGF